MIPLALPLAPVVAGGLTAAEAVVSVGVFVYLLQSVSQFRKGARAPGHLIELDDEPTLEELIEDYIEGAKLPVGFIPPSPQGPQFDRVGATVGASIAATFGLWQKWQQQKQANGPRRRPPQIDWGQLNNAPETRAEPQPPPNAVTVDITRSPRVVRYLAQHTWNYYGDQYNTDNYFSGSFSGNPDTNIFSARAISVSTSVQEYLPPEPGFPGLSVGQVFVTVTDYEGRTATVSGYPRQFDTGTMQFKMLPYETEAPDWVRTVTPQRPTQGANSIPAARPAILPLTPTPSRTGAEPAIASQPQADTAWQPFIPPMTQGMPQTAVWEGPGPLVPGAVMSPLFNQKGEIRIPFPSPVYPFPQKPAGPNQAPMPAAPGQATVQSTDTIPSQAPFYNPGPQTAPGPLPLPTTTPQPNSPTQTDQAGQIVPIQKGAATATSTTSHFINGQEVTAPSANASLQKIATELQRVEKKLEIALTKGTPSSDTTGSELVDKLTQLYDLLNGQNENPIVPEEDWVIVAPCDKDAEGNPISVEYNIEEAGYLPAILARIEAIMAAFSETIAWRQPVCKGAITNNVTITAYSVDDRAT